MTSPFLSMATTATPSTPSAQNWVSSRYVTPGALRPGVFSVPDMFFLLVTGFVVVTAPYQGLAEATTLIPSTPARSRTGQAFNE